MECRTGRRRRIALWVIATGIAALGGVAAGGRMRQTGEEAAPLSTGRAITPQGQQTPVGSFPANLALSPDGKWLVVTNTGFRQFLSVLSTEDGHLVSQVPFNSPRPDDKESQTALYVGLAFGPAADGGQTLYVSRGPEDRVSIYKLDAEGKLTDTGRALDDPTGRPKESGPNFVAGIALSSDGARLYAVNNETSLATHLKGAVSVLDTAGNRVLGKVETPGFPYAIAALTQGAQADKKVYVTSERDGVVSVLDVTDPASPKLVHNISTGDHPMALRLDKAQARLFVANAGSDTVSVIDTASDKVLGTILLRPEGARGLPGATPTGLALSTDESHLYVSLADMNAVAAVRLNENGGSVEGYLPAGWYPTAVAVSADGARLFVANAKGAQPRNPNSSPAGPNGAWGQYIQNILEGTVSTLTLPAAEELNRLTAQTVANARIQPSAARANQNVSLPAGIKHVIYIIKENRTYDQVLGDMPQGNGDPGQVLFGRDVTPNLHALAERFVLLDNFYCCAEVSADGWGWSTSGMISEYTARNAPFNYSGRGRDYDFEGENNGVPVDLLGVPDVARAPSGYIWDQCLKRGVSFRNYGFYVTFGASRRPDGRPLTEDNMPARKALVGRTDESFRQFDMAYADSNAWLRYTAPAPKQKKAYGKFSAPSRFAEWKREFDDYVRKGNLPAFLMVRLPRDHTQGTAPGLSSPRAMVADNDYAVGQLVEAVSKSRYWRETAIFVIEDDAQSGHDHVDAHRSICFVISPYIKRATVDHRFYNTDSVLHTMEALLGLPPLCQYDAAAPILDVFGPAPDNAEPYAAILPARDIIAEVSQQTAYRARDSQKLDFSREDRVPDAVLNDILWHAIKGARTPEPPIRHGLRLTARHNRDDD